MGSAGEPGLVQGVERFNRQEWWDAHESWEQVWIARGNGPEREYLQGLIQAVACFHLLEEPRIEPAQRLAAAALAKLRTREAHVPDIQAPGLEALLEKIVAGLATAEALASAASLRLSLAIRR